MYSSLTFKSFGEKFNPSFISMRVYLLIAFLSVILAKLTSVADFDVDEF